MVYDQRMTTTQIVIVVAAVVALLWALRAHILQEFFDEVIGATGLVVMAGTMALVALFIAVRHWLLPRFINNVFDTLTGALSRFRRK